MFFFVNHVNVVSNFGRFVFFYLDTWSNSMMLSLIVFKQGDLLVIVLYWVFPFFWFCVTFGVKLLVPGIQEKVIPT